MPKKQAKKQHEIVTVGRRKTSAARVFLTSGGSGKMTINARAPEEFFGEGTAWYNEALRPIEAVNAKGQFDFLITVKGGGITGQSGAVRLGIARALDAYELSKLPQNDEELEEIERPWHKILRSGGFLTRDPRAVLRKLVGRVKARKKKQFSKR